MSESNSDAAFETFRARIRYLCVGAAAPMDLVKWPPSEVALVEHRAHVEYDDPNLERAIADLWEQARIDAMFSLGESGLFNGISQAGG